MTAQSNFSLPTNSGGSEGQRGQLEAIRDRLKAEMDSEKPDAAVASLAKELRATLAAIASLPDSGGSKLDDLADRRNRRRAGMGDSATGS